MKIVLNHIPLTPEARTFNPDKAGCPGYAALIILLGTSSIQWCTEHFMEQSGVWSTFLKFLLSRANTLRSYLFVSKSAMSIIRDVVRVSLQLSVSAISIR